MITDYVTLCERACHCILCYKLAMFGDYRHCDSGKIMFVICHVIPRDHVIKESHDFISKRPSRKVKIMMFFVVEEHYFTRSFTYTITIFSKAHGISCSCTPIFILTEYYQRKHASWVTVHLIYVEFPQFV